MKKRQTNYDPLWELEWIEKTRLPDSIELADYKPTSLVFYWHLMREAKRQRRTVFDLHTKDVLWATGLHRETLIQARAELGRLVRCTETRVKGVWSYEILNPESGAPLPDRENVEFSEVSDWAALEFYRRLLPGKQQGSYPQFDCPLGIHAGSEFHVILDSGSDRHGCWRCRKCNKHGGFVHAYAMVRNVSRAVASRAVRVILKSLAEEEQRSTQAVEAVSEEEPVTP